MKHPNGNIVISHPHTPSGEETWFDSSKIATFTPLSNVSHLNSSRFIPSTINHKIEIDFVSSPLLRTCAGIIMVEDERVWVVSPTNGFASTNTFPKGECQNEHLQTAAAREVYEETGFNASIDSVLGDIVRRNSKTRYYLGRRLSGSPSDMAWESQALHLVPLSMLEDFVDREKDKEIARLLIKYVL